MTLRAEQLAAELLAELGVTPDSHPETAETPRRWVELLRAWSAEPELPELRPIPAPDPHPAPIVVAGIGFHSLCVHHLVPYFGVAHIVVHPATRILGFGSYASVVRALSRRLQLQEDLATQLVDTLDRALCPVGVAVALDARQMCVELTGSPAPTRTIVYAGRGTLRGDAARTAFAELVR